MAFFACSYTIHFDDTMAYGSHHFLTSFKFQCASRETFLFGDRIFDFPGVKETLHQVHLLTSDAYARNLHATKLGDRVAILLTLEEWGQASARFCYRVIDESGQPVCAGFQTLICADAETENPMPLPPPLREAMDAMREIEELPSGESFRDRVLAGGSKLDSLFGDVERDTAIRFLSQRYPSPKVVTASVDRSGSGPKGDVQDAIDSPGFDASELEAWVFAGQGAFDAQLLSQRLRAYWQLGSSVRDELDQCAAIAGELIGGDSAALIGGSAEAIEQAVRDTPELSQVAIHLQNVLGARLWRDRGHRPTMLMGHSFGEIAAFGEAGCFDLPTGVQIVCLRGRCIQEHAPPDGGLFAVFCERHRVETEASLLRLDQVVVAGRNHDKQTIASGPLDQLHRLEAYFRSVGIGTHQVRSPSSFHHPRLRWAAANWLEQLRPLAFHEPIDVIYSPVGRRFVNPGDDIASVLASQLVRPFDLQGSVWDAAATGVTTFVDCGSTGALTNLISECCPDDLRVSRADIRGPSQPSPMFAGKDATSATDSASPTSVNDTCSGESQVLEQHGSQALEGPKVAPAAAIVARGCILPGGVHSPEQLLTCLIEQRTGIVDQREFDPHWSEDFYSETLVPDRSTSHLTGRISDVDIAVPPGVDPHVFEKFTRAQRLLCIALAPCAASLEGAERVICVIGATADGFEDQDEAWSLVYAGIDPTDPDVDQRMNSAHSAFRMPHEAIQEVFDQIVRPGLRVMLVDAACASSLYSVALGMQFLETGEADAVIAGGSFCPGPGNSCLFSQFRGTTSTGCRPFDASADGVVFSEGAALVTLRRVTDAEHFGLNITATVRGAGLSSDGRSSSANVPQSDGQILSLQRCYAHYEIDPTSIHAIEAHGTSTPVGDSTELETLRRFFADHSAKPLPVHSLKGRLGHAGWAAGTASVIAACEYLRSGIFPAQASRMIPSDALKKSSATLSVPTRPISLSPSTRRIAIDGFGFGGANAHLVIERYDPPSSSHVNESVPRSNTKTDDDELVVVACHQLQPTQPTATGLRFDRDQIKVPPKFVVLPDLADDMDISQTLAVLLTDGLLAQLPNFDDELRRDTSVVLAMSGKTERGIEATTRIMTNRLRRRLRGHDRLIDRLNAAYDRARPSKSYTLQCMMPNVAAGRAALLLNLNGPNLVIDSGSSSLHSALDSASLLLRSGDDAGTKLAVVAAISANSFSVHQNGSSTASSECAVAFGVTTRRLAREYGWKELRDVSEVSRDLWEQPKEPNAELSSIDEVQTLVDLLRRDARVENRTTDREASPTSSSSDSGCRIHTPMWVERQAKNEAIFPTNADQTPLVAIVPADAGLVTELVSVLPTYSSRSLVAVVGNRSNEVVKDLGFSNLIAVDPDDAQSTSEAVQQLDDFKAHIVAVIQTPVSWEVSKSLSVVAHENCLSEFLFLLAQRSVERLKQGAVELWSLVVNGWAGVVHPQSGSLAGLLKSIHREIPAMRTGSICTRGGGLVGALRSLAMERSQQDFEQEVVYDGTTRLVRRLSPTPSLSDPSPQVALDSSSVVIATGGARGVTSVVLEALLCDYRCTVIVLGRSRPEPGPTNPDDPAIEQQFYRQYMSDNAGASPLEMKRSFEQSRARWEAHKTIQQLKSLGGHVEYKIVDVTNRDQVTQVLNEVAARHGKVDLLIHGAGIQVSKQLGDRTLAEFRRTYAVKVGGLDHLVQCCQAQFGRLVSTHVLTSAYSIFGNDGQHDYGAANETMDRICALQGKGDTQWSSIAWLAWDGIGMTRGSEYRVLSRQRGLSTVNPPLGKQLFREVLQGRTDSAINVPLSDSEHLEYQLKTVPPVHQGSDSRVLEVVVDLSAVECLRFHKVRDTPTLPGAWVLDYLVQAAMQLYPDSDHIVDVTVRDLSFTRFVRMTHDQDPNVRAVVEQHDQGACAWMLADVIHPTGRILAKDVICAQANLSFGQDARTLRALVAGSHQDKRFDADHYRSDPYCERKFQGVDLSGPFNCLSNIQIGRDGRRATFTPDGHCHGSGQLPAMLLDAAWRVGAMYTSCEDDRLFVPVRIGRMVIPVVSHEGLTAARDWEIHSTPPRLQDGGVHWDRTEVLDRDGVPRLVVENAYAKRIG